MSKCADFDSLPTTPTELFGLASHTPTEAAVPRTGMLATVRNRRGLIAAVDPFDGDTGRLHMVSIEYKDDSAPSQERLLWELEPQRSLLEPNALPDAFDAEPMPPEDFDALLRAARWTALSPYLDPDGDGPLQRQPVASPFHGGVSVEDYQLAPLLKALRMPRISLLIADDVGLGKTVEAGLVLTELLLRRRIQRVLVLTPASLRLQWQEELADKFSLRFEIVDRQRTERLRRRLGLDANPWRSHNHVVASYHYLRQPDVLEQFIAASRTPEGSPRLPWDFLIVDECHNLMPSPFGDDSELCQMLRIIAPLFEHKLFLSATPHNGHTRSFTGLLEMLDPVRFTRSSDLTPATRRRVRDVVVRRLKRDINAIGPKRFCTRRAPEGLTLAQDPREAALTAAFAEFRRTVRALIADGNRSRRRAGSFAIEILGKRLLSCPTAFAESWRRAQQGLHEESAATESEVMAAQRAVRQETGDDREAAQREATAATVTGAWLKPLAADLSAPMAALQRALDDLGFDLGGQTPTVAQTPKADARFDALLALIQRALLKGDEFREDERLIVFTEYKTTLDYLARRLRERFAEERVLTLYGGGSAEGMGDAERDHVKAAFNDPNASVRILVATDAASEGLNLHRTARYLLHYDCPWNPSRLEQRNGRLDRYGQARDVTVHHFVSEADADLQFLAHVIHKADEIREDLGSVNEVFDRAAHQRLIEGEDAATVRQTLDAHLDANQGRAAIDADDRMAIDDDSDRDSILKALAAEIDLDPGAFGETLESAMAIPAGRPQLQVEEDRATYRIIRPDLPQWRKVIDDSVRRQAPNGVPGPVPLLAFSPEPFIERLGELSVFSPRRDALLMHLAHPMMQRALTVLSRRRYPGGETAEKASRWTVRRGDVPTGADALVLLSVEELAVNRLRETFHRWVRTLVLPIRSGELGEPLPHVPAHQLRGGHDARSPREIAVASELLEDVEPGLKRLLKRHQEALTQSLRQQLNIDGRAARDNEDERYRERQGEVSALIEQTTSARLEREIAQLKLQRAQGALFDEDEQLSGIDRSIEEKQREIDRRRHHYEDIRAQLRRERERILDHLLPARYAMEGEAQVFPVTVEVRLP